MILMTTIRFLSNLGVNMKKRKDFQEADDDHAIKVFKRTSVLSNSAKEDVSDIWRDRMYEKAEAWGYDKEETYRGNAGSNRR